MLTDFQILHHGPGQEDAAWPYECQLYFGREIEKDVRAEDAKVIRQLVEALENAFGVVVKDTNARNLALQAGRAWLNENPNPRSDYRTLISEDQTSNPEAPHATPA